MGIFDRELTSRTERKFENYMDSGGLRDLINILLKKALTAGILGSLILNIVYYHRGTIPLFGNFSIMSGVKFTAIMIPLVIVVGISANLIIGAVTYLILSRKEDIDFKTILAANVIGNLLSKASETSLLIKKNTQLDHSEVKNAIFVGVIAFAVFLVFLSMILVVIWTG